MEGRLQVEDGSGTGDSDSGESAARRMRSLRSTDL